MKFSSIDVNCSDCGNSIKLSSKFCQKCGEPVINILSQLGFDDPSNQRFKFQYDLLLNLNWRTILGSLFGISLGIIIVIILTNLHGGFDLWVIFVSLLLLSGILFILEALNDYINGKVSSNWPTTEGEIQFSELRKSSVRVGSAVSWHRQWVDRYHAIIIYSFNLQGVEYLGNQIRRQMSKPGSGTSERSAVRDLENYPVGKKVIVYYNPKKHSQQTWSASPVKTKAALLELRSSF
ncbi:MAG: DUF3592 domain-containing protein [Candidatus Kariarchaeaceae archaeon]